jgi:hypothetical protein
MKESEKEHTMSTELKSDVIDLPDDESFEKYEPGVSPKAPEGRFVLYMVDELTSACRHFQTSEDKADLISKADSHNGVQTDHSTFFLFVFDETGKELTNF